MSFPIDRNPGDRKVERKIELPPYRRLIALDEQDMKTLDSFLNSPTVEIYLEPNPVTDYVVHNADGSITRVAATPTINGVQWIIPAGEVTKIPLPVHEFLKASPHQRRLMPMPAVQNACIGHW